jgi:uncharacterized protein YbaR (Trm112 family)
MHTQPSVETRPFDVALLKILRCPETRQELQVASSAVVEKLNGQITAGGLKNRTGQIVSEKIAGGLIRADNKFLYPILDNIPILLVDEAIPLFP